MDQITPDDSGAEFEISAADQALAWIEGDTDERPDFETDDDKRQAVDELVAMLVSLGVDDPMTATAESADFSCVDEEDLDVAGRALEWYLELTTELDALDAPETGVDRLGEVLNAQPSEGVEAPLEMLEPPDDDWFHLQELLD